MPKKIYSYLEKHDIAIFPREVKSWLRIWLGCNIFALFNVVWLGFYDSFITMRGHNWARDLLVQLLRWNIWALLITPIVVFVKNHPYNHKKTISTLIIYFGAGVKYSFIHNFSFTLLLYTATSIGIPGRLPFTLGTLIDVIINSFWGSFIVYIAVIAFIQASSYYENYQKSEYNYKESLLHASQLQTQLVQAQLDALKSQLQPHFIFNALNSISALQLRDVKAAQKMIANLGQFLRLVFKSKDAQEVVLKKEIDFLKCYLDIEQVRFQDRLTISFNIEEEVMDAKVPSLMLQPIVENAIKHGISQITYAGYINISAKRIESLLMLQVEDNGLGIDNIKQIWKEGKLGVGLSSTKARLEHLYGIKQKLELNNRKEGGLKVTVLLPLQYFPETTLEVLSVE